MGCLSTMICWPFVPTVVATPHCHSHSTLRNRYDVSPNTPGIFFAYLQKARARETRGGGGAKAGPLGGTWEKWENRDNGSGGAGTYVSTEVGRFPQNCYVEVVVVVVVGGKVRRLCGRWGGFGRTRLKRAATTVVLRLLYGCSTVVLRLFSHVHACITCPACRKVSIRARVRAEARTYAWAAGT